MEQANLLVNTHSAAIIIVLLLIVLVALGMCFSLQGRLNKLQKKYDFFTQGKEANIDVVLQIRCRSCVLYRMSWQLCRMSIRSCMHRYRTACRILRLCVTMPLTLWAVK